nr:hypothetical protein [Tanacetum cinerariifolium]
MDKLHYHPVELEVDDRYYASRLVNNLDPVDIFKVHPMEHGRSRSMDPKAKDKGKLILFEKEIINLNDIKPTDSNTIVKVRTYRKWVARNIRTKEATNFYCILLDK